MICAEMKKRGKDNGDLRQRTKEYSTFIEVTHQQESWYDFWLQQESGQKYVQSERCAKRREEEMEGLGLNDW